MKLTFETNFLVFPKDLNPTNNIIFGGKFMSELDIAAASAVRGILRYSICDSSVTYKMNVTFLGPSFLGDTIHIKAEVTDLRTKSVSVKVLGYREPRNQEGEPNFTLVATANFVFVTKLGEEYTPHGLVMEE